MWYLSNYSSRIVFTVPSMKVIAAIIEIVIDVDDFDDDAIAIIMIKVVEAIFIAN